MKNQPDDQEEARRVTLLAAARALKDNWVYELDVIAIKSRYAKARYDALRREGFEVTHALALCVKNVEL